MVLQKALDFRDIWIIEGVDIVGRWVRKGVLDVLESICSKGKIGFVAADVDNLLLMLDLVQVIPRAFRFNKRYVRDVWFFSSMKLQRFKVGDVSRTSDAAVKDLGHGMWMEGQASGP